MDALEEKPPARSISPDDVEADAIAGRLIWEEIEREQHLRHWGAL